MYTLTIMTLLVRLLLPTLTLSQEVEDFGLNPEQLEERLFEWVNRERDIQGQMALTIDTTLREVARAHSQKMADENKLSHHFPNYPVLNQRVTDAGLFFSRVGENVAAGETFVMRFVHEALMDSPEHRKNILLPDYSHLGIGIIKKGDIYYTTQVFAQLLLVRTAEEIEQQLIKEIQTRLPLEDLAPMIEIPELKTLCRERAAGFMNGKTIGDLSENWTWGKAELISHTFSQPREVMDKLLAELINPLQGWILGAAFGRTQANSGGICSVTLITFPKLVSKDNPEKYLFDQLNKHRVDQGKSMVMWSDPLAQTAGRIARSFQKNNQSPYFPTGCRLCFVYETVDLTILPEPLLDLIVEKNTKFLGVHVLILPIYSFSKNALIIAVAGN